MLQTIIDDVKIISEKTGDNNAYRHHQVENVMAYIAKQAEGIRTSANEEEDEVIPSAILKQETDYLLRSCKTCKSTACKMGCPKHPCVIREVLELL